MRRWTSIGLTALAFIAMSAWWSQCLRAAPSVALFVQKSQLPATVQNGKVYAPATLLLKAMGYQWTASGGAVQIAPGNGGGPDMAARVVSVTFTAPGGKTVTSDTLYVNREVWVQVKPLADALGALYIDSSSAGIVQVMFRAQVTDKDLQRAVKDAATAPPVVAKPSVTATTAASKGSSAAGASDKTSSGAAKGKTDVKTDGKGVAVTDKEGKSAAEGKAADDKDVVVVDKLDFSNPIIPGSKVPAELRGTVVLKNTAEERVTNLKFTVELDDQGGNPVASLPTKFVSVLEPGQTASTDFIWYNYYNQYIQPKVKIDHDPVKNSGTAKGGGKATTTGAASPTPSPSPGASNAAGAGQGGDSTVPAGYGTQPTGSETPPGYGTQPSNNGNPPGY